MEPAEMRVMLWPQLSMRNYETGKWHLEMDPNLMKDRAWIQATPEWDWYIFTPQDDDLSRESGKGLPKLRNVVQIPLPWAPNVQTSRINFPFKQVASAIRCFKPEAIILESPEHALPIRMIQDFYDMDFPVFSYVNYLEGRPESHKHLGTTMRFLEGAIVSDRLVFNTEGLLNYFMAKYVNPLTGFAFHNVTLWPGVYTPAEVDAEKFRIPADPPAIFYTSRLSDPKKNRHPEVFEALKSMASRKMPFQVWVGNPNDAMGEEEIRNSCPNVTKIGCNSREEYLQMVNEAAVIPTMWPQDKIYSIGYCDALAGGAMSVVAREGGGQLGGFCIPANADVPAITRALEIALLAWYDPTTRVAKQESQREWLMRERSVEENIDVMVEEVESFVGNVS
jgi:hypothetical protein